MDTKVIKMVCSISNTACDITQIENRINEEIEWGLCFRQNRNQEKQLCLATTESLEFPSCSPRKPKKKKPKRKKPKRTPVSPVVSERLLFDRNTCTQKQYYNMLSQPRPKFHETEAKTVKSGRKSCSPRFEQLALPLKQRVLNTWQDYEDVLAPENILWLKNLLTREEALAPKAAGKYFSKLDANKRKAKKKKLKKQREHNVEKPKKSKIVNEIEGLSKDIVNFFADKMAVTVKYRHMMITEIIKDKLVANNLVKPYKRNKRSVAGQTLHELLDQLAVWLETNIASLTDEDLEKEEGASEVSSTVSSTSTSEADSLLIISAQMETASVITIASSLEVAQEAASIIIDLTEDKEAVEEEETGQGDRELVEEAKDEAPVIVKTEPEEEEEVIKEEDREKVDLQDIMDGLIDKAVEESGSKITEEPAEHEIIDVDALETKEPAEPELIDVDALETKEAEEPETIDLGATETKEPSATEVTDVEAPEVTDVEAPEITDVVADEVEESEKPKDDKEGRMIVEGILNEYIDSIDMEKEEEIHEELVPVVSKLHVEEHSPDTTCCVAMKKWAIWLAEVARNTHSWCQWIQEVIAKIRFFASILKGDVKTADGKRRILYKEEWNAFKETLESDMAAWIQYNTHVRDLSDKIIANFQNKRVVCCPACLEEKLIVSEETAHEVGDRLAEAIQKASYWRTWLEQVVDKARKLTSLEIELPTAPENYSVTDSALASYTSFDLIEIKPIKPVQCSHSVESSDTSVYLIEEFQ